MINFLEVLNKIKLNRNRLKHHSSVKQESTYIRLQEVRFSLRSF